MKSELVFIFLAMAALLSSGSVIQSGSFFFWGCWEEGAAWTGEGSQYGTVTTKAPKFLWLPHNLKISVTTYRHKTSSYQTSP